MRCCVNSSFSCVCCQASNAFACCSCCYTDAANVIDARDETCATAPVLPRVVDVYVSHHPGPAKVLSAQSPHLARPGLGVGRRRTLTQPNQLDPVNGTSEAALAAAPGRGSWVELGSS